MASTDQPESSGSTRPIGAPEIPQFHLRARSAKGVWAPRLYGSATIQFADRRLKLAETRRVAFLLPLDPAVRTPEWDAAQPTRVTPGELLADAPLDAAYLPLPPGAMELKTFTRWAKQFDRWLARTQQVELTTKRDPPETVSVGPKRGGVSVELVAIVWELT